MSASFSNLGTTVVSSAVEGSGLDANPTYEQAYSWELSRHLLGGAAFFYESTNVLSIQSEINLNGSKLQLIPLALFMGALLVLA
jgi:hypothetical protein